MEYNCLNQQEFSLGEFKIVPIRFEDRYFIMQWRNEQMYHLRQSQPLTAEKQDDYFTNTISNLFIQGKPQQILFSFLKNDELIGYGGLVHIHWVDQNAEISFLLNTELEGEYFAKSWSVFLKLIQKVAFNELLFHKIYTYAFDLRPHLYPILESEDFQLDATLKEHVHIAGNYLDVKIHSKYGFEFKKMDHSDIQMTYGWATNEIIRKFSFNQEKITWEEHELWFNRQLKDVNCYYYLFKYNKTPVGSLRVNCEGDFGIISFLIDPKFHGLGFGHKIIECGISYFKQNISNIKQFKAYVMFENEASKRIFENQNFQKINEGEIIEYIIKIA